MYPSQCKTVRANSLVEASTLLREFGSEAHVLAGGQSLIPLMKQRMARPGVLIDVSHLTPPPIEVEDDRVTIHALTTHADIGSHETLTERFDVIRDVVPQIADPQVRNMGTIGGALAEADPGNDWGPALIAARGTVQAVSPDGRWDVPVIDFFEDPFTTALDHEELIESVTLPLPGERTGGAYLKEKRRQGGYGIASAVVQLTLDDDGRCESIGYALADDVSAYVTPEEIGDVVEGAYVDDDVVAECREIVTDAVDPIADTRGSAEYKRNLCGVLFERALRASDRRAKGEAVDDPMKLTREATRA